MKERTILKRGEKKEVKIESIAPGGEGVSKDFGLPIFIERAAVADELLVEITEAKSNFARGTIVEVLKPSLDRAEPACQLFDRCGGCQWQHLSYPAQLKAKADIIRQSFRHIANLPTDAMHAVVEAPKQLSYRNKVQFLAASSGGNEGLKLGYYEAGSHNLVDIHHCPIQPDQFDAVINLARTLCHKFGISAYDEKSRKGLLRSVSVRQSESSGEMLVTLVLNCPRRSMPTKLMEIAKQMLETPKVIGICANFLIGPDSRLYGEDTICLAGKSHITEVLKTELKDYPPQLKQGLLFQLSATSFFQVNSQQAIKMLEIIHKMVEEFLENSASQEEVTLLDAYAGVGAIALWLTPFVDHVIAIEENPVAVEDARINIELNDIKNIDFYGGRVEDAMLELINERIVPDIVVIDPPRKGCSKEALERIIELAPRLIIYVSCNPVTLARDLKFILGGNHKFTGEVLNNDIFGYKTKQIVPIDFFPQTFHIESITVLERHLVNDEDGHLEEAGAT